MAFDHNTIPVDLRFLNVAPTMSEDARVVPLTTPAARNTIEGFITNSRDGGTPNSIPLYYPSPVPEAGLLGVGNKISGVPGWLPVMPTTTIINPTAASATVNPHCYNSISEISSRTGSNVSDQVSDEGGDDSLSLAKKIKFMCTFGGKILPRPSDGLLRYVGGQTRIISVRKEVTYYELLQKLVNIYGQNLVIKYQLPEEDLDALVSVSCQDDLINMMDEYNKLVDGPGDGSSHKLRVFLFSSSELDSPNLGQLGDLESSGQRYVEAVNGIGDTNCGGGGGGGSNSSIMRRDSIASASTQNSDCGNEGADSSTHNSQGTGELSPRGNSTSPRLVCLDTNNSGAIFVEASSCTPLAIPMVKSQIVPPRNDQQEYVNVQRQPMGYYDMPVGSYVQSYIDPHQKVINRTEYVQTSHHQGQLVNNITTMHTQQQYHNDNINQSHHYIPTVQMPMNHSSQVRIRPNQVRPMVQTQQVPNYECFVDKESSYGQRVSQYTGENSSHHAYQSQANNSSTAAFCDGWMSQHQQVKFYDKNPKYYDDCYMCQKMLPHTHTDNVSSTDQKDNSSSTLSSPNSVYDSPSLGDTTRVCNANKTTTIVSDVQNFEPLYEVDKTEYSKIGVARLTCGKQPPYNVVVGTIPPLCQENIVQQQVMPTHQYITQEDLMNRPFHEDNNSTNGNLSTGRTSSSQISDHQYHEISPKDYSVELRGINPTNSEACFTYDMRQMDRKVKNLQITPTEVVLATEIKSPAEQDFTILKQNQLIIPSTLTDICSSGSSHLTEKNLRANEWSDIASHMQAQTVPNEIDVSPSSTGMFSPASTDSSNSLLSNQHPWNLRNDTHVRPPFSGSRLSKESPMNSSGSSMADIRSEDVVYDTSYSSAMDLGQEQVRCNKDLSEGLIKQDLETVAEGVAVSVLHSNLQSNVLSKMETSELNQNYEVKNIETETRHGDKSEDMSAKITEKSNLGSPLSEGFGRLQIIKDCDLEELRELGSGTFGTVYHGKWRGSDVAIKRINDRCFSGKPSEQERMRDDFWNEAIKLGDLHHPNVVAFYGVVLDGPEDTVATVTEYMANGSLRTAIEKNERNLDNRKRLIIAMDVAFGMEYLHGKNIVHFDLKSDNLLVNLRDPHRPICKVGDLGLSKVKCQTLISGGVRGTLPWMAPELLNGSSSLVSEKVDVFSFGMVMWELLTGDEPYGDLHYGAIIGGIVSNTLRPPVPESCDVDWRTLMERCWSSDPLERPSFTEIANQLRVIASKVLPRGQNQQSPPSPQTQLKT